MIPYVDISSFTIAGATFHTFGLLVAIGVLAGHAIVSRRHQQLKLGPSSEADLFCLVTFTSAFFFAHFFDAILYRPDLVRRDWRELFMIHHGLSSFGGFAGTVIGAVTWMRVRRLPGWVYSDLGAYAFPVGWIFGRAGCSVAHDHKGRLTDSWLAVRFPDGPRYDLGLIELALTPLLLAVVLVVARRDRRPGMITGALAVAYPFIRFPLDFLRATDLGVESDPRHFGLTPAQWACFGLLAVGLWVISVARRHAPLPEPA
ncbi:MAG: prolipoprotein diacylglyceryl transferase family protein [Polyangiales bacterium]